MIDFNKTTLDNGLVVVVHQDATTPIVAVNLAYDVGARDEDPELTGLAHYFEHLMFSGSKNAPDYDKVVQNIGGQNNAFTSNDYTNYYLTLPKNNLEVALWLEADRMQFLNVDEKSLEVQRKVVIEEFKQNYLNQPYGNNMAELRRLTYENHPYQWATIGKSIQQIEKVTLSDARSFYNQFYAPNNCILTICGDVDEDTVLKMVNKYFGQIPASEIKRPTYNKEAKQKAARVLTLQEDVPLDAFLWSFKIDSRNDKRFPIADLVSDILGRDESSLLFQSLAIENKLVNQISAYVSGDRDPGMFIISGKMNKDAKIEEAEKLIWAEISALIASELNSKTLKKVQNKYETAHVFGEMSVLNKAMNLAYNELCTSADDINTSLDAYLNVTSKDIQQWCAKSLVETGVCKLHILKSSK